MLELHLHRTMFYSKSTFFNALTASTAATENFPFCTIDPNENKSFLNHSLSCNFDKVSLFILMHVELLCPTSDMTFSVNTTNQPAEFLPFYMLILVKKAHEGQVHVVCPSIHCVVTYFY